MWNNLLERLAELVQRSAVLLSTPNLIAINGAKIGDLDDNGRSERTRVVGSIRIGVGSDGKATTAGVTRTDARRGTVRELVDRSREAAASGVAARWKKSVCTSARYILSAFPGRTSLGAS